MIRPILLYRLMLRPMWREPVRMILTILAVALGVAVVLAMELAGNAAVGSFHSSLETLAGGYTLEIVATGGVPEAVMGTIETQADMPLTVSPRFEDFATITETKQTLPLIGIDMIAEGSRFAADGNAAESAPSMVNALQQMQAPTSIWVGRSLGKKAGEQMELVVNDEARAFTVRGVYSDPSGDTAILMDLAGAQKLLQRRGRLDRILVKSPENANVQEWQKKIGALLPVGVEVRAQGTGTAENQKMLGAFRWNLRLLSYISLVVGAFLIYNTIAISVVRRRAEIGIVRAIGASRGIVFLAFLGEAAGIGLAGALIGIPLGRVLAGGAVKLMGLTVQALYASSRPGAIEVTGGIVILGLVIGAGVAVASAWGPAREAMRVTPVEAMAVGRREYAARVEKTRDLLVAGILAAAAFGCARMPAVSGKPLFGYVATLLLIGAGAYAIPALVTLVSTMTSRALGKLFGVETLLASRSLVASLARTSVLVGALATAVAMMTAVGIMVGSFRQTVVAWMETQLPADLYLRPAGEAAADRHPTMSVELVEKITKVPGVAAVERLRAYEISMDGKPVELASVDLGVLREYRRSDFLSGRPAGELLEELRGKNSVIVSEPFTNKHGVKAGDSITLTLGGTQAAFRIADVFYDYGSERGTIVMDRETMLRYLRDPAPSNMAVYVEKGVNVESVRREILHAAAGQRILIFSDSDLRREAIRIFDRTFAITYALEAIAVLVAVMGVAGALMALVIDRRRELGLLRFLGASAGQIRKLILTEAGLLGFLANLAGFALGYVLSLVLVFVINKQSFGWTIRFHWPVAVLVGALTVVYAATVLAGMYPARVAVQLNPLEVIHEE
jgi:putative ABC transport system permease protein